jgi:hypothetical protein
MRLLCRERSSTTHEVVVFVSYSSKMFGCWCSRSGCCCWEEGGCGDVRQLCEETREDRLATLRRDVITCAGTLSRKGTRRQSKHVELTKSGL